LSLTVGRISEAEAFSGLAAEWQALEEELSPRLPFATLAWNASWWAHLRRRTLSIRDEFYFHTVREDGRLVAIAPLMISVAPGFGPLRYRHLQFVGADLQLTELRGVICREADEARVLRALCEHLAAHRRSWDSVRWSGVRDRDALKDLPGGRWRLRYTHAIHDYCLALPTTWAELHKSRRRNVKESLRRAYNSLRRDGHEHRLVVITRPEEAGDALHRAEANFARRHPNLFRTQATRAFLADCALRMAQAGQLCIFELRIGDEVVASRVAFLLGKDLYYYYSGFNPQWGRYSVMTALVAESLKWAIERGCRTANLSVHPEQSKLRWGPAEIVYHEYVQVPVGLRHELPYGAFRLATHVRRSVRRAWRSLLPT